MSTPSPDPDLTGSDLRGKVAVITGASTGIGRACAATLAREGMKVVLSARRGDRLQAAVEPLRAAGHDVLGVVCDVADRESVQQLADETVRAYGRVDVAFLNAGIAGSSSLLDLDLDAWSRAIGTNLYGLLNGIKAFLPLLDRSDEPGSILATSSATGLHGVSYRGAEYATTKGAQVTVLECLYGQLRDAGSGVHVGVVLPPLVRTNLAGDDPSVFDNISKQLSGSGRSIALIEPEEFAEVVLEGIRERRFWIEADEDQNQRLFGGRNGDTITRGHTLIQRQADAMINHTAPDRYLW